LRRTDAKEGEKGERRNRSGTMTAKNYTRSEAKKRAIPLDVPEV
jgi:hypothetical protein